MNLLPVMGEPAGSKPKIIEMRPQIWIRVSVLSILVINHSAHCKELEILKEFDRVSLFVCDQRHDKILETIRLKDNRALDKVIPNHYRFHLFSSDFDVYPDHYKFCLIFQKGSLKNHRQLIVWVKKLKFSLDGHEEHSLESLLNEIDDKSATNRLRGLLNSELPE